MAEFADEAVLADTNTGAERKLWWADRHAGLYFTCDDDIVYPPDYVERMTAALRARSSGSLVTAHGRTYAPRATRAHEILPGSIGQFHQRVAFSRHVNHGGTGCMAWDAGAVQVPTAWPQRNLVDMQLAVWAQQNRVPIWLLAHEANWFEPLLLMDPHGIYRTSQAENHARRNALLAAHSEAEGWKVWD